jgi:predicted nucleotidyltransferase
VPDLSLPEWLTPAQRATLVDLAARNDAAHGDDLLGLVLSGSAGRGLDTERSDLDVVVVLTDQAASTRSTVHAATVDEAVDSWTELITPAPFGCAAHDEERGHTRTGDMIAGWGDELDNFA